jgi:hypothetical protein
MLRVVLFAALVVAGLISFGIALTVDCGGGASPPWVDIVIGSVMFGVSALLVATQVSTSSTLSAYVTITTTLVALCVGLVLVSLDPLGRCAS